ncbi:hypothetical protein FisN_22Hu173 [Fistulifera solaris]|uniref:Uncharacterized protein n=1 Tax=Fistulifera solaris TaxID=1519565 RepID=A0A1Z5JQ54_FISSO|nr:hypothetical protein FisN_22Hu173 [Fistulifera solaris]|eukprot:GAX15972.1 hypothetical protein FisN_22Hu173 [Fistulifera solaris]
MDFDHLRVYGIGFAFAYSFGTVIQAAVVHVVAEYYTQSPSTFQGSLAVAFDQFFSLFGYSLLYAAALFISFVVTLSLFFMILVQNRGVQLFGALLTAASVALSVYVMCSLTLALPVLVVEKQSPFRAIIRAFELFPTYGIFFFCVIFPLAVVLLPVLMTMSATFKDTTLVAVCKSLPVIVTLPLQTIFFTVLYLSIRVQKDGLNMEMLMNQLNGGGGDAQSYAYDTLIITEASP